MRSLFIFSLFIVLCSSAVGPLARAEMTVMGFQDWKTTRIEEAKAALEKLTGEVGGEKPVASGTPVGAARTDKRIEASKIAQAQSKEEPSNHLSKTNRNDPKVQQAELNIEVAHELTVNDYFVLYLNQFKEKDALLEAAKKLSPEEVAELMMAYKRHLSGIEQADAQMPGLIGGVGSLGNPRPAAPGM